MEITVSLIVSALLMSFTSMAQALVVAVSVDEASNPEALIGRATHKSALDSFLSKTSRKDTPAFPYWNNIGKVGMGTGIYLGEGMVLTSTHVGCFPLRLNHSSYYKPIYRSWRVLKNTDGSESDLAIFQVLIPNKFSSAIAQLAPIPVSKTPPRKKSPVIMMAAGLVQSTKISALRSNGKVLAVFGYHTEARRSIKWGWNSIADIPAQRIHTGNSQTYSFVTVFPASEGKAQAVSGDSGGAAFIYNAKQNRWELAGCIFAISNENLYIPVGSQTYCADLSDYFDQFPQGNRRNSEGFVMKGGNRFRAEREGEAKGKPVFAHPAVTDTVYPLIEE